MNYLYFFINILVVVFFCYKLKLIGRGFFSAPGIYLALSLLPTVSLVVPSFFNVVSGRAGIQDYMISIVLHSLLFCFGLFIAYFLFNSGRIPVRRFVFSCDQVVSERNLLALFCFLLAVVSLVSQILMLGDIPILSVFTSSDVADLTNAREAGYKLQGGVMVYLWHFSRMVFVPYLVVMSFCRWFLNPTRKSKILFLFVMVFAVVNNSLSGAVAPVAMLFLCIGVAYVYLLGRIRLSLVVPFVMAVFTFPFIVEYVYSEDGFWDSLLYFSLKVVNRFSFETFDRTLSYFDYFPYVKDYLGGRTNSLVLFFSGEKFFNVQNYIFLERLDSFRAHLLHGSANAHFIGYMNADFGLLGVAISCLLVGVVVGFIDVFSSKNIQGPSGLALYVVLGFILWKLMGSQPTAVFFSHGAVLCCILIWVQRRVVVRSSRLDVRSSEGLS